jgi:transcriptional regulator with PAS, ATPase and Fis domain
MATINCSTGHPSIVGNSKHVVDICDMIDLVGKTDSCVLITGESGTGKELVADAIHAASRRAQRPLVKLNCAALPETLLESELFGYTKGSFTGAEKNKCGLLKSADGGTLFFDEIGDLSLTGQSKLLRVLENKEFSRIGETIPTKIDVRIIAATNQNLACRMQDRLFREDLYYRLNVVEIHMPPLRERTEDIPALVEHFLNRLNSKLAKSIHAVSDEVLVAFLAYSWPGNIRELSHVLERACIVCQNTVIDLHHLPPELQKNNSRFALPSERQDVDSADELQKVLSRTGGNKAAAARVLGINRKTLYRHLKKYHISLNV